MLPVIFRVVLLVVLLSSVSAVLILCVTLYYFSLVVLNCRLVAALVQFYQIGLPNAPPPRPHPLPLPPPPSPSPSLDRGEGSVIKRLLYMRSAINGLHKEN
jgi:hypothetical protein